jgi:hypothetical protein
MVLPAIYENLHFHASAWKHNFTAHCVVNRDAVRHTPHSHVIHGNEEKHI